MALTLFAHPFSSYCQKVLIALYENDIAFALRELGPGDPSAMAEIERVWPFRRFPVLDDGGRVVIESSIIIEYLAVTHPGPVPLLPADPNAALDVRFMDRFFDNYVSNPQARIVFDALRPADRRDPTGVADARAMLDTAYGWLEHRMSDRTWASGETFSLADCAAAPALFYADWTHRIAETYPTVHAYRARLNARPSFARCIEEARRYRPLFPLGAPDRD